MGRQPRRQVAAAPARPASPLSDAPVSADHRRLDVDGVVAHAPQLQRLVQRPHHVQRVVSLCGRHGAPTSARHGADGSRLFSAAWYQPPARPRPRRAGRGPDVPPTPQIQRSCAHGGYASNHLYSSETKRHLWGSQSPDLAEGPRDFGGAEATSRGRGKSHLQRPKRLARGEVGLQEAPTAPRWATRDPLTSTGIGELRPPKEAQEARPCPDGLGVSEAQPGAEVVGLEPLLPVDRVVPGGVVGAAHPDLGPRGQECRWAQVRGSLSCRRERQDGPLRGRVSDRVAGSGREGGQAVSSPSRGVFPPSAQE